MMKKLFSNVGRKLQKLAGLCAICGIIALVVGVICMLTGWSDMVALGIALLIIGISSIIGALPLYAFGQITDDVHEIRNSFKANLTSSINDLPEL